MTDVPKDGGWILNNVAVVFIAAPVERVWSALTDAATSANYFMGSRVEVGEVGGPYCIGRDDGWGVTGVVLVKAPPSHLRVTWVVQAPPGVALPNCQVDYLIETAVTPQGGTVAKLTVSEFVDGPVPPQFRTAGRTGWGLITSNLKTYLETGAPLPTVKLEPPQ
jgi:uncharacterized protein YndB with AHSA1/START domain